MGLYGVDVSLTLVSNVTDKLLPLIQEWQQRPLAAVYPVVFLCTIHFKVRQERRVVKPKLPTWWWASTGRDTKNLLGMWIGEHELAKF